jgi:hypothetical protein
MKKTLLLSVFGFVFAFAGVASASGSVVYPSTFSLKVGESVNVSNYQNMKVELVAIKNYVGDCESGATPCPLGNPVSTLNAKKIAIVNVSTEGGCGPNADSRCLGAPAFNLTLNISEGAMGYAQALGLKVTSVTENSVTFSIALREKDEEGDDSTTIHPLPPEQPKVIPIGRDFGGKGDDDSTTIEGAGRIEGGKGIVYPIGPITICPMGKEDCTVCSNGSCKEKTIPYTEGTATAPGVRMMSLPANVEISSVDADKTSTSSPAYKVKAVRKARLFYLFPVKAEVNYTVDAKTGSSTAVSKPWWNFLAW